MQLISPDDQAVIRRQEAKLAMDSASYLAEAMPTICRSRKKAAGQQILFGFRTFLAFSQAAAFWDEAARKV